MFLSVYSRALPVTSRSSIQIVMSVISSFPFPTNRVMMEAVPPLATLPMPKATLLAVEKRTKLRTIKNPILLMTHQARLRMMMILIHRTNMTFSIFIPHFIQIRHICGGCCSYITHITACFDTVGPIVCMSYVRCILIRTFSEY